MEGKFIFNIEPPLKSTTLERILRAAPIKFELGLFEGREVEAEDVVFVIDEDNHLMYGMEEGYDVRPIGFYEKGRLKLKEEVDGSYEIKEKENIELRYADVEGIGVILEGISFTLHYNTNQRVIEKIALLQD